MQPAPTPEVLISAHRCGAGDDREGENGLQALQHSIDLGVDFVEFDVQRMLSGDFVISHDIPHEGRELLAYEEILRALGDRVGAHLDFKFDSPDYLYDDFNLPYEIDAVKTAIEILGDPTRVLVTTNHVHSVRAVRNWADAEDLHLKVGLSLGRLTRGMAWRERLATRYSELFPSRIIEESRANVVVVHHSLATLNVQRWARTRGLPLLVWTVDDAPHLRWWLRDGMAWLVTSNHPALALDTRDRIRRQRTSSA